jgi:Family of unknown function (DUF6510)
VKSNGSGSNSERYGTIYVVISLVHEMTSARVKCEGCSAIDPLGAEHVYMQAPGIVVRCCHCESVLLVITQRDGSYMIGFQQIAWLET